MSNDSNAMLLDPEGGEKIYTMDQSEPVLHLQDDNSTNIVLETSTPMRNPEEEPIEPSSLSATSSGSIDAHIYPGIHASDITFAPASLTHLPKPASESSTLSEIFSISRSNDRSPQYPSSIRTHSAESPSAATMKTDIIASFPSMDIDIGTVIPSQLHDQDACTEIKILDSNSLPTFDEIPSESDNGSSLTQDRNSDSMLPSSSPPSSSPPIISSEPDLPSSQTTAPFEDDCPDPVYTIATSVEISMDAIETSLFIIDEEPSQTKVASESITHSNKTDDLKPMSAPKRSTMISQRIQHQKLKTPFRSPLMKKPEIVKNIPPIPVQPSQDVPSSPVAPIVDPRIKHRTQRASGQFKSPLSAEVSSKPNSSIRLTPTIQALERKLQVLKRAVKVKTTSEEQILAGLAKRWTEAGRDVAWEVWDLIKDNGQGSGDWGKQSSADGKRGFQDSWGWTDGGNSKRLKGAAEQGSWGWDDELQKKKDEQGLEQSEETAMDSEEVEEEVRQDTLGSMLRQWGIAPETLGWDDDEGSFVDN
ncbi:hypothetical protein C8J56DRAFT_1016181 [Mycena floridula]|nr:hypothetical protein C8J56DRAFT_1016181 [Mycena floridula]